MSSIPKTELKRILTPDSTGYLTSRENTQLKFEESFDLANFDKYAQTLAGFANTQGGWIIFGVKDAPHIPVGLTLPLGIPLDSFEKIDPKKIDEKLAVLTPKLKWHKFVFKHNRKKFGVMEVEESDDKPIVATKDYGVTKEDDVYYRYRGQTKKIKHPELRALVEERVAKERQAWVELGLKIAEMGPLRAEVREKE